MHGEQQPLNESQFFDTRREPLAFVHWGVELPNSNRDVEICPCTCGG